MKKKILKIAKKQLLVGGYGKLNFANIADDLNTTRANLYYHFKDKENLALEVFKEYEIEMITQYNDLRNQSKNNYVDFFIMIEKLSWNFHAEKHKSGSKAVIIELVFDADLPKRIEKMCRELYEKLRKIVGGVLQDGLDCGMIKKKIDVDREATRALAIMVGMFTSRHHFHFNKKSKEQLNGLLIDWAISLNK
ncbi:MAG: hypothetical protein CMP91_11055 [Gammaproteobacteria bacterium]|nr:hypothetical protein [Gammaproteobacteria bacterium]|tara:strand:- start:6407 stop:6985 length:579 start_codon:yes stop_codon:yes gene_type:complete